MAWSGTPQKYPPENGQGEYSFQRWYVDDITGFMFPEFSLTRDYDDRLRERDDLGDPDADELTDGWVIRTEASPEDP
jgi:hypothetical protein